MPIARKFLDWSLPALPAAVDYLIHRYSHAGTLDLERVITVVPGKRAGRRLLEILVEKTDQAGLVLSPPRIETVGRVPELLYESKRPFATNLVQQLTWVHALRSLGRRRIVHYIPELPADDDVSRWLELGRILWRQHRELAGDALHFGDVVELGKSLNGFKEGARWKFLREVQLAYLGMLDQFGLWDLQTARLFAIQHRECRLDRDLVLLYTADLNRALRAMLDQVADRVTTLIHAPPNVARRFDEHGCLLPEEWEHVPIAIETAQVRVVAGPAEQAETVARIIAGYDGRYRADEITVGLPDASLAPQIERQLEQCGVRTRWVVGKMAAETGPCRLLEAVAAYAEHDRFTEFASLVRHPDLHDWLQRRLGGAEFLMQLDEYHAQHLQPTVGQWLGPPDEHDLIAQAHALVEHLVGPLKAAPRKLAQWSAPIQQVLLDVYGDVELDRERPEGHYVLQACRRIHEALNELQSAPPTLLPSLRSGIALKLLLEQLATVELPPLPDELALELLGWLELPLDHSPALVVTTFNEGFVPESASSDLFLPNGLRQRLGIVDNDRRYARDAYALTVLLASRQDVSFVVARHDVEGNPLAPSRLLFACDAETTARRALAFLRPADPGAQPPLAGTLVAAREASLFAIPRPEPLDEPLTSLPVTAFRSYLACPYRFYLRHVLNVAPIDDAAEELGPADFGDVCHEVLRRFGTSPLRHTTDAGSIRSALHQFLADVAEERYGSQRLPAVNVQLAQLRLRLDAFADWQARWAGEGWRIKFTEVPERSRPYVLRVETGAIEVRGRIDRIDLHEPTGEWFVFDYKTSDQEKKPREVHRRGDRWVDLQLPLYRRMVRGLGVSGTVKLGYILLPKDVSKTGASPADWNEAELAEADATADDVVRKVLAQVFWPPADPPPDILTDYAVLCQEHAFEKRAAS